MQDPVFVSANVFTIPLFAVAMFRIATGLVRLVMLQVLMQLSALLV